MTCIVAYKKGNLIYVGGDSAASDESSVYIRKDPKVFIRGGMIFGFTTSFRMGSLLKYHLDIPKKPSKMSVDAYMNTLFIDNVIECLTVHGFTNIDSNVLIGGQFIVGYKRRLFFIDSDFQVAESVTPYYSCGSGAETALGALNALLKYDKDIKPERLVKLALESASENTTAVRGPYKILKL